MDARTPRAWASPLLVVPAVVIAVVDQLTKAWAVDALDDRNIDLFWTLRFNLSFNTGMAFSTGRDWGPVIGVLALAVIVALLLSLRKQSSRLTDVSAGLIVGGAIGNVIDRLFRSPGWFRGAVIDFIDFQWFPIFNVADMGITVGGALLVLASWLSGRAATDAVEEGADPDVDPDVVGAGNGNDE
ncbi:MAG: signal peptidase II [Ilumatobacter sp.]|uniref:signal peptidase II n=1 Tax=Ilumatobacter sp. TaxID=1967498 RepID=UPI00261A256F|nr:signal peptidase II [Ilumatobacter sp.]MDJ0767546.1 signal peptidase II [Ilumatobacter sp.]